jgi:plastocyanin
VVESARAAVIPLIAALFFGVAAPVAAASETHTIVIEGFGFAPQSATVRRGDTIVWVNKDLVPHTATSTQKGAFDSGEIAAQKSWKYVAKTSGTFPYICTFHPTMKATLVVK